MSRVRCSAILEAAMGDSKREPRRTKIICTLGPSTETPERLKSLIDAGMDIARLNFSHGTHAGHGRAIRLLRRLALERDRPVAILQDLQGPKIRTGLLKGGGPVYLRRGTSLVITTRPIMGNSERIATTFAPLPREVKRGDSILLSDGLIELRVEKVSGQEVMCRIISGGELGEHQGINLPGIPLKVSALTTKDRRDLRFGIQQGVDYVAVSFVRRPQDILQVRSILNRAKSMIHVIAKLEKPEALEHLDEILEVSDAVMVARGDLGVEMTPEKVPILQKRIITRANQQRVPVITATQMLESMTHHPRPTRAEASDVANAIFDGTDAVMLSQETAIGEYPIETVAMMSRIVREAEGSHPAAFVRRSEGEELSIAESICRSVARAAQSMNVRAIAVFTQSGSSARMVSMYRPRVAVYAFSPFPAILRRISLYWGVFPRFMKHVASTDRMIEGAEKKLLQERVVKRGDIVALVAGTPIARRGTTNLLKLHRVGHA